MIAPAADTTLPSAMLLFGGGEPSGGGAALEPFGAVLMHEQTLFSTTPAALGQASGAASTALALLVSLVNTAPATLSEEDLPQEDTLLEAEEDAVMQSLLQALHVLLHPVQPRVMLPEQAPDTSQQGGRALLATPEPSAPSIIPPQLDVVPQLDTLLQQTQAENPLSSGAMFSGNVEQEGSVPDTDAVRLPKHSPAGVILPMVSMHDLPLSDVSTEANEALSAHTLKSLAPSQPTAKQDGAPKTAGQGDMAVAPDDATAAQTPLSASFGVGVGGEGMAETRPSSSAETRGTRVPQLAIPLAFESVAQLPERLASRHTLLLQLHPAELGALRIRVRLVHEHLSASFWADSPEVRSLLQSHFPTLQQHLSEQGFPVPHMSMSLATGDFAGQLGQFAQQHAEVQPRTHRKELSANGEHTPDAIAANPTRRDLAGRGRVDVII